VQGASVLGDGSVGGCLRLRREGGVGVRRLLCGVRGGERGLLALLGAFQRLQRAGLPVADGLDHRLRGGDVVGRAFAEQREQRG